MAARIEKDRIDRHQPIYNGHSKANLRGKRALINEYVAYRKELERDNNKKVSV